MARLVFAIISTMLLLTAVSVSQRVADKSFSDGVAKYNRGDYETAIKALSKSISKHANAEAYCYRGKAFERTGKVDEAISDYSNAIETNPRCIEAFLLRAKAFTNRDRLKEAKLDYLSILALDTTGAFADTVHRSLFAEQGLVMSKNWSVRILKASIENEHMWYRPVSGGQLVLLYLELVGASSFDLKQIRVLDDETGRDISTDEIVMDLMGFGSKRIGSPFMDSENQVLKSANGEVLAASNVQYIVAGILGGHPVVRIEFPDEYHCQLRVSK
jgi:hypothetical protein